jgi:glycerate kinase
MRVLVAFDKFKNSISASAACDVAAGSIASAQPCWEADLCPLSDGGEGFMEILTRSAGGAPVPAQADGPRGGRLAASFGIVPIERIPSGARGRLGGAGEGPGTVAVVEMAAVSGLALLDPAMRDLTRATTRGTGQLIVAAAAAGPRAILLGVGGSATNDLGLGALGAMGMSFAGADGGVLDAPVPADWPFLRAVAGRVSDRIPPILIACDVVNPLFVPNGALAVYGLQKGLRPGEAPALEAQGARIAAMLCRHFGRPLGLASAPGAGAAGGIAFGLMAGAGAELLPGFEFVSSWLDLDRRLAAADIVITGEGRFDESSLSGKGPGSLVRRALGLGKPVHVFAGQVALAGDIPGLQTHAITPAGTALALALASATDLLSRSVLGVFSGR